MQVYKRSILGCIMGIIGAHFAAFLVAILLNFFLSPMLSIVIALLVYFLILYISIFSDNIKIEVDEDRKTLSYYQKGKLKQEYDLKNANISYHIVSSRNRSEIDLIINGETIDCEPLGMRKFEKMYAELEKIAEVKPISLKVGEAKNK